MSVSHWWAGDWSPGMGDRVRFLCTRTLISSAFRCWCARIRCRRGKPRFDTRLRTAWECSTGSTMRVAMPCRAASTVANCSRSLASSTPSLAPRPAPLLPRHGDSLGVAAPGLCAVPGRSPADIQFVACARSEHLRFSATRCLPLCQSRSWSTSLPPPRRLSSALSCSRAAREPLRTRRLDASGSR